MTRTLLATLWLVVAAQAASPLPLDTARMPPFGWVRDSIIGVEGGIPARTNLANYIDVTASPYNADKTGATDSLIGIQAAITAAVSNSVVYFPTGTYKISNFINHNKSGVTLRGEAYNGVTIYNTNGASAQCLKMGGGDFGLVETIAVASGSTRGSTNIVLSGATVGIAGDIITIKQHNFTNELFQVISTQGFSNVMGETLRIVSKSGVNLVVWPPLTRDYTNSPTMDLYSYSAINFVPLKMAGIENIIFTQTYGGNSGSHDFLTKLRIGENCWFLNSKFIDAENYNLIIEGVVNCYVGGCSIIGRDGAPGSNKSGILSSYTGGLQIENCFFDNDLAPAVEFNERFAGNFFNHNLITNVFTCVIFHNSHAMMNGFEGNKMTDFKTDGYFGSNSEMTLYRNVLNSPIVPVLFKRFSTYNQVVGNVLGDVTGVYSGGYAPTTINPGNHVLNLDFPNIGNFGYTGETGPTWQWNWPGTEWQLGGPANGSYTVASAQTSVTNLTGDYDFVNDTAVFIGIQQAANTNMYRSGNSDYLVPYSIGTGSNLELRGYNVPANGQVTTHVGDVVYKLGPAAYQARQSSNRTTQIFNANYDYYNDSQIFHADYSSTLFASLIDSNSPPSWRWRTNMLNSSYYVSRIPEVQPDNATLVTLLAAEIWPYDNSHPFIQPGAAPTPPPGTNAPIVVTGKARFSGAVNLKTQ